MSFDFIPSGDSPENRFFRLFAFTMKHMAIEHMRKHKWYQSENAQRDVGVDAINDWEKKYWWTFCHFRRLEHIQGRQCWIEFHGYDFAVTQNVKVFRELLNAILERMNRHSKSNPQENLEIIKWAGENPRVCMEHVFQFLELININSARLELPEQWKKEAMAA